MNRVAFLVREALVNLRRNLLVVIGSILAVFISLGLAFGALAANELLRINTLAWQEGVHIIAFLHDPGDGVSADAHQVLINDVATWEEVADLHYVDKAGAWQEYQEIFANRPDMLETIQNPAILPASIRIELRDIEEYQTVEFRLLQQPQIVDEVDSFGQQLEQVAAIRRVLGFLGIGMAAVLGAAAVILIANTIALAIYARRDEVSIMKLVGASNWFVRVPFLLEGLIEGVVGASLAVFSVWVAAGNLAEAGGAIPFINLQIPGTFFLRWGVVFLLFGAAAGVLGSMLGLSRYLREADGGRLVEPRRALEPV